MCSTQFTNNDKIDSTFNCKVHMANWFWQFSVGSFHWSLVPVANLWLQLMRDDSWCFPITVWSKMKVKQWRHIPKLPLLIKHLLYELDSTRRILPQLFVLFIIELQQAPHINFFSITFWSLDNQQNKNQAMIHRVCQFPYKNIPILADFRLQATGKRHTVDNIIQHFHRQ